MSSELAQVNVAVMRAPLSDPVMRRFVFAFDPIARLAAESPGFVWQHRTPSGHETRPACDAETRDAGDRDAEDRDAGDRDAEQVVNLSVWQDYASLHAFVYRSAHGRLLLRRSSWFLPTPQPSTALWWVESGTRPTVDEALARLSHLRRYGPTPKAFSLLRQFHPDGTPIPRGRGRSAV